MASRQKTLATPPVNNVRPNSVDNKSGRYTQGGDTIVLEDRLGWWERTDIEERQDDDEFLVTSKYVGRPDLIAYDKWGKANLAWLVLQYNNIVDLTEELVEGTLLVLPSHRRVVTGILVRPTGGKTE